MLCNLCRASACPRAGGDVPPPKVFSAGVMNFGGSALWPTVSTMVVNLWAQLTRP